MRFAHVRFREWTVSVMNQFPHVHEDVTRESLKGDERWGDELLLSVDKILGEKREK